MGDTLNTAYVAGILDGEGCFRFTRTALIEMSASYPQILMDFQLKYGGKLNNQQKTAISRKPMFRWYVSGPKALCLLEEVLPYLREKRPQALLLRRVLSYPPKTAMRHALLRELKALKRIPYSPWFRPLEVTA